MRDLILNKFVIVNANLPNAGKAENSGRMDLMEIALSTSQFKDRYKLVDISDFLIEESAFLVVVYNFDEVNELLNLARDYSQDSVFYVDSERNCFSLGTDNTNLPLGILKMVSKSEALESHMYIFDSSNNQYYQVASH